MDEKAIKKYRIRRDARIKKRMDAFEENEHPRDENGRFTSGGGGRMKSGPNKAIPAKDLPPKEKTPLRNGARVMSAVKRSASESSESISKAARIKKGIDKQSFQASGKNRWELIPKDKDLSSAGATINKTDKGYEVEVWGTSDTQTKRMKAGQDSFERASAKTLAQAKTAAKELLKSHLTEGVDLSSKENTPKDKAAAEGESPKTGSSFKRVGDTAVSPNKEWSMVKRKNGSWDLYHDSDPRRPGMGKNEKAGSFKSFEEAEDAAHEKSAEGMWNDWQNDRIGGITFENRVKDWAENLPVGVTVSWGEPGHSEQSVRKTNKGFEFEGKGRIGGKQTFTDNAKDFAERLRNNLSHDLMANDWEDVKIRVKRT